MYLVRSSRSEGGVKGQIGNAVLLGNAGLYVATALAIGLGAGTAPGVPAGQLVDLGVKPAGREFLRGRSLLPPFPPIRLLR